MKSAFQAILIFSAVVAVAVSGFPELHALLLVARPLATFAAAMLASSTRDAGSPLYRLLVLVAITIALTADFLGASTGQEIKIQLYCAAAVQAVLLVAYVSQSPLAENKIAFIAYVLVVSPLLAAVYPAVSPTFRAPLVLSIGATSLAAAQSVSWMLVTKTPSARLAGVGGAWFVVSLATFVIDRFLHPVPLRDVFIMGTHWIGLWAVARSVSRTGEL